MRESDAIVPVIAPVTHVAPPPPLDTDDCSPSPGAMMSGLNLQYEHRHGSMNGWMDQLMDGSMDG